MNNMLDKINSKLEEQISKLENIIIPKDKHWGKRNFLNEKLKKKDLNYKKQSVRFGKISSSLIYIEILKERAEKLLIK